MQADDCDSGNLRRGRHRQQQQQQLDTTSSCSSNKLVAAFKNIFCEKPIGRQA
jgi:hypothetical protein